MTVQRGVLTSQAIPFSSRNFTVEGNPPPCFCDRWGEWQCGHEHDDNSSVAFQDIYQYVGGWTAQRERGTPMDIA
jgi:hypothetical protein